LNHCRIFRKGIEINVSYFSGAFTQPNITALSLAKMAVRFNKAMLALGPWATGQ
jgi:hypothetical protein